MNDDYKQIEEMVKIMNECCNVYDEQGNHIRNKCYECECWSNDNHCCCSYNRKEAEALYNAGYRKQKESEWVMIPVNGVARWRCGNIDCARIIPFGTVPNELKYCPNCGAKMKGGE